MDNLKERAIYLQEEIEKLDDDLNYYHDLKDKAMEEITELTELKEPLVTELEEINNTRI